jgi:uroporphyrinogen-III synthase
MTGLQGRTVAITEARRGAELATLVEKLGGVAYPVPAVREVPCADLRPAVDALERICRAEVAATIFVTGVGTRAFLALADSHGRRADLVEGLARGLVAARGPKTVSALREASVRIDVVPLAPTSEGVLEALAAHDLAGKTVAVQRYGDDNDVLARGLGDRGARVIEIPLYEWTLPESLEPLERLVRDVIGGHVDVVTFTSSPQVRHVVQVAERLGLREELVAALGSFVTVAAVGPVCAATLADHGVPVDVQPERQTMGALVHAIAAFLATREATRA